MEKLMMFMMILASTLLIWVKDIEIFLMDRAYRHVQYSLEHAVHDATLQVDTNALSDGYIHFLEGASETALFETLQRNLPLDQFLYPTNHTLMEEPLVIRDIFYLDDDYIDLNTGLPLTFPFIWEYRTPSNYLFKRSIFGPSIALVVDVQVKGSDEYKTFIVIQEYKKPL